MHLVRDPQPLLGHGQIGDLTVQVRVVDGDRCLHREPLQRLLVALGELVARCLLTEIEVADEWSLARDGDGQEGVHHGMIRGKAVRARVPADVGQTETFPFTQDDAEQSMSDRRRSDARPLCRGDA